MEMPTLQALVERHADSPFTLLGINTGDDESAFRRGVEEFEVTWTCTWQREPRNPIAELYQVTGYPTIYVLDAKGRIRFKDLRGEALEKAVQVLLDELEAESRD